MSPEEKARLVIDQKLIQSGWVIQDLAHLNLSSALGIAVRYAGRNRGKIGTSSKYRNGTACDSGNGVPAQKEDGPRFRTGAFPM